jgi:hypothetical protein
MIDGGNVEQIELADFRANILELIETRVNTVIDRKTEDPSVPNALVEMRQALDDLNPNHSAHSITARIVENIPIIGEPLMDWWWSSGLRQTATKRETIRQQILAVKESLEQNRQRRGETRALLLFQQMAKRVPAYKDYLKKHKVNPAKIKTIADFKHIPTVDKRGYLKQYDLEKLCWDGKFSTKQWTLSSTSGTTGEPFYFPRTEAQDRQYALSAELYLRSNFQIHKKSTLYVDAFAMGAWIGGLFSAMNLEWFFLNLSIHSLFSGAQHFFPEYVPRERCNSV